MVTVNHELNVIWKKLEDKLLHFSLRDCLHMLIDMGRPILLGGRTILWGQRILDYISREGGLRSKETLLSTSR